MNTEMTIECPYCGSTIRKHVDVCLYCRKEVQKIIRLQDELAANKALVKPGANVKEVETPAKTIAEVKKKKIPLGFFAAAFILVASLVLTYSLESTREIGSFSLYEIIFFLSIPVFIYIGIAFVSDFSIWILALLALFLPKLIYYLALEFNLQPSDSVLSSLGKAPFVFTSYVLLAGLLFTVLVDKVELKAIFGISALTGYLSNTQTALDKIEKLILIITTVIASLKTISAIF